MLQLCPNTVPITQTHLSFIAIHLSALGYRVWWRLWLIYKVCKFCLCFFILVLIFLASVMTEHIPVGIYRWCLLSADVTFIRWFDEMCVCFMKVFVRFCCCYYEPLSDFDDWVLPPDSQAQSVRLKARCFAPQWTFSQDRSTRSWCLCQSCHCLTTALIHACRGHRVWEWE